MRKAQEIEKLGGELRKSRHGRIKKGKKRETAERKKETERKKGRRRARESKKEYKSRAAFENEINMF